MNKKTVSLIAMIVSALIVFFGILVMAGAMGGDTSYASSSYLYDSGYASFGADFYTYVNNNAAEAASATRTVASNLGDIAALLKNVCGIFLMGFGLLGLCHFTLVWLGEKQEKAAVEDIPEMEAAAVETADVPEMEAATVETADVPEMEAEPAQEEAAEDEVISS